MKNKQFKTTRRHLMALSIGALTLGWGAQAQAVHVAADRVAVDQLAVQLAHRQLARQQHAVPDHQAILQRYRQAGEQFARPVFRPVLPHPAFQQLRAAQMAVAVATALRTVVAQAPCGVEDGFAAADVENGAAGLQGYFHVLVI